MRVAAVIAMIPVAVASVLIVVIRNAKTGARSVSSWLVLNIIIDEENEKWKMKIEEWFCSPVGESSEWRC